MAPECSQCRTKMVLEIVEPHPVCSDRDTYRYRCKECGLADQKEFSRLPPFAPNQPPNPSNSNGA